MEQWVPHKWKLPHCNDKKHSFLPSLPGTFSFYLHQAFERERERIVFIKKFLVCPEASVTWKKAWCYGRWFLWLFSGENQPRNKLGDYGSFYSSLPKSGSSDFCYFFPFLGGCKESSFSYYFCHYCYLFNNNSLSKHRKVFTLQETLFCYLFAFNLYFV